MGKTPAQRAGRKIWLQARDGDGKTDAEGKPIPGLKVEVPLVDALQKHQGPVAHIALDDDHAHDNGCIVDADGDFDVDSTPFRVEGLSSETLRIVADALTRVDKLPWREDQENWEVWRAIVNQLLDVRVRFEGKGVRNESRVD